MHKNVSTVTVNRVLSYLLWFGGLGLLIFGTNLYSQYSERQVSYHRWTSFVSSISTSVEEYPYRAGIIVRDLTNNFSYYYKGSKQFISASLIKLPIMCSVFEEINRGNMALDNIITLKKQHKVSGSGSLRRVRNGAQYSVEELLKLMIKNSDNTAAKILTDRIGLEKMNRIFKEIGLQDTNISHKSFNMTRRRGKDESYTTPYDIVYLLEKIYYGMFINQEVSNRIIEILKTPDDNSRLSRYLPDNFELAHKTGLLRGACHDAGIVFTPKGAFLICVMTEKNLSYNVAKRFIANLGKLAYDNI